MSQILAFRVACYDKRNLSESYNEFYFKRFEAAAKKKTVLEAQLPSSYTVEIQTIER